MNVAPTAASLKSNHSALRRWYVLLILTVAYACAYLDRSVIAIILPQLKREFHFGDTGLGFLSGMAFAIFFVLFGLPAATLADRSNRRNLIAGAIALWSVMTALCGYATSFAQLVLTRVGVGVGEAGLTPPAHSIISDLFPQQRRGTALAIYSVGIYIGILLGLSCGGYIAEQFGWRRTFLVMAAPGMLVSILFVLTVREPVRGASETLPDAAGNYQTFLDVLRFLWVTPALRYTLIGITFCSLFTQTQGAWLPSFLVRTHGMTVARAGLMLGVASGVGGGLGTLIGGRLSDTLGTRDPRWRLWVVTAAFAVLPISALIFLYSDNVNVIAAMAFANALLAAVHLAPTWAVTQNLTPFRMRARAVAVTLFLISLVGGGIGPILIGALSDLLYPMFGLNSLRYALTTLVAFAVTSAGAYFVAGLHMRSPEDNF